MPDFPNPNYLFHFWRRVLIVPHMPAQKNPMIQVNFDFAYKCAVEHMRDVNMIFLFKRINISFE